MVECWSFKAGIYVQSGKVHDINGLKTDGHIQVGALK